MARFGSTQAFIVNHVKYKAGQTFADTRANAIGKDVVWPDVANSSSMSPGLVALDAGAIAIYNASRFVGQTTRIDGANSIGGIES
jgi:hypothetical protein